MALLKEEVDRRLDHIKSAKENASIDEGTHSGLLQLYGHVHGVDPSTTGSQLMDKDHFRRQLFGNSSSTNMLAKQLHESLSRQFDELWTMEDREVEQGNQFDRAVSLARINGELKSHFASIAPTLILNTRERVEAEAQKVLSALTYETCATNIFATLEAARQHPDLAARSKYKREHLHKFSSDPEVVELLKQTGPNPLESAAQFGTEF